MSDGIGAFTVSVAVVAILFFGFVIGLDAMNRAHHAIDAPKLEGFE